MNKDNLKGIFTALLTPFDVNNKINEKELEKLVKFNVEMGVKGFYVGGSTAEAFLLTTEERKQIMEIVKAAAPNHTLIAHVGSISEDEAITLGKYAKQLDYDVVSSVAPLVEPPHCGTRPWGGADSADPQSLRQQLLSRY